MTEYRWNGDHALMGGLVQPGAVCDIDDAFTTPGPGWSKVADESHEEQDSAGGEDAGEGHSPSAGTTAQHTETVTASSPDEQAPATATVTAPAEQAETAGERPAAAPPAADPTPAAQDPQEAAQPFGGVPSGFISGQPGGSA